MMAFSGLQICSRPEYTLFYKYFTQLTFEKLFGLCFQYVIKKLKGIIFSD